MLVTRISVSAAVAGERCSSLGSAMTSTCSSGVSSALMPLAVSAATLPRNNAFMTSPPARDSGRRDDVQQRLTADEAVDVTRRIGTTPARHSLGPGRAVRRHDDVWQFVKRVARWADIGLFGGRVAVPSVERRAADNAVAQRREQRVLIGDRAAPDIDQERIAFQQREAARVQ